MKNNAVVECLNAVAGNDAISFYSGSISYDSISNKCSLSENDDPGCVYGIAIKIKSDEEKKAVFESIKNEDKRKRVTLDKWEPIDKDGQYYPLYWGKDKTCGSRVRAHTKTHIGTGSIQLNKKFSIFNGKEIIYGLLPCCNYSKHEKDIQAKYPHILKTHKGQPKNRQSKKSK